MSKKYDVVIVGDGILGYSTAFSLFKSHPKLKVALIAPQKKNGASLSSGAMLNCFSEITETTFLTKAKRQKFDMAYKALKKWPSWIETINNSTSKVLQIQKGTYILLNTASGSLDTRNFELIKKSLQDFREEYEEISPTDVPGINPLDSHRPLRALYLPNEGSMSPLLLIESLKEILCSQYNLDVIDSHVTSVNYDRDLVQGVTLKTGETLSSEKVLLATGAYTQEILDKIPEIKDRIPLTLAGVGIALLMKSVSSSIKHVIRTPNRAGACGLHVVPRESGKLYVGATNNVYSRPQSGLKVGLSQFLLKCAVDQIDQDFYNADVEEWVIGNRPVTVDTFPLMGESSIKGLFILAGTYRDGLHLSPYLSQYMADSILGEETENHPFKPERSFIPTHGIQESIEEYLSHYGAGGYEHGMILPPFLSEKNFLDLFRAKLRNLYDELEIDFGLSPDILLMMMLSDTPKETITLLKNHLRLLQSQPPSSSNRVIAQDLRVQRAQPHGNRALNVAPTH